MSRPSSCCFAAVSPSRPSATNAVISDFLSLTFTYTACKSCENMLLICYYSQTFEKRSSLPPNPPPPPAGLLCAGCGLLAAVVVGAALLHPPKSSSGATFGAAWVFPPKPLLKSDDWAFEGAELLPQAEKSLDMGIDGA